MHINPQIVYKDKLYFTIICDYYPELWRFLWRNYIDLILSPKGYYFPASDFNRIDKTFIMYGHGVYSYYPDSSEYYTQINEIEVE